MNDKRHKQIHKSLMKQQDQSDCGPACLLSVIRYHGGDYALEDLRELSGTTKEGSTMLGLVQAACQIGFDAVGYEADFTDLSNLKELAVLHVTIQEHLTHFVVFYGCDGNRFVVGDPSDGILELSKEELSRIWVSRACCTLSITSSFRTKASINKSKILWFKNLISEDFPILLASVALGILISLLSLTMALFQKKLVDNILPENNYYALVVGLLVVAFLLLIKTGLSALRSNLLIEQRKQFNIRITGDFLGKLLHLPKPFFDTRKIGDFVARLNDTGRIQAVISQLVAGSIIDLIVVLVCIIAIFFFSTNVGIISLVGLTSYFILIYRFNARIINFQKSVMANYAANESNYIDIVSGIADIKSYNKYESFEASNHNTFSQYQGSIFNLGKLNISLTFYSGVTSNIIMVIVLGYCSWQVISESMALGTLFAIVGISSTLIPAVSSLALISIPLNEAKVAFDRMFAFSSMQSEDWIESDKVNVKINEICISGLYFGFPGRAYLLKGVDVRLEKGQLVTLLGESGSGKSTFLEIIQKFYEYKQGTIEVNKNNLECIPTDLWRNTTALVPQQIKLYNGSILYNICLSQSKDDYRHAMDLCEDYGLGKFIKEFPQGYSTIVGDGGINLSGGQKQIVAIARALFSKPQLLLLDEATGAMDRNTENFVLNLLQDIKNEVAILMVTHRIKAASRSDYVYILENGVISHEGNPTHLLNSENFYSTSLEELRNDKH
jgi:ABC-type bacteriocin/lantibiotic exporter with double-glycine peptidase domain